MKGRIWTALVLAIAMLCSAALADGGDPAQGNGYIMPELYRVMPTEWETQEEYENPDLLLDGIIYTVYQHTCWNSRSLDDIPEITFFFNCATIGDLWIRNGNQISESDYYDRARIKILTVTVVTADGVKTSYNYTLQDVYNPNGVSDGWVMGYQRVGLPRTFWNVIRVELGIPGWYRGNSQQHVVNVSDLVFTGEGYAGGGGYMPTPAPVQPQPPVQPPYDGGYTPNGRLVTLKQRMATRSGPGTQYTELGSYFQEGTAVTAVSAAFDDRNDIWWIQTEFTYNGEKRRAYTGVKRLEMMASDVPAEFLLAEDAVLNQSVYAYWGPGYGYAMYNQQIPAGTSGKIWQSEGEYAQFEFFDQAENAWRRVWVQEAALEGPNG